MDSPLPLCCNQLYGDWLDDRYQGHVGIGGYRNGAHIIGVHNLGNQDRRRPVGRSDDTDGCGVLQTLSNTAQNELANLITLLLGITISFSMRADDFVRVDTVIIMLIGLVAFIFDTIGGVLFAKVMNLFLREKINPMIGAAGISAFPMSSRVVQKLASEEEKGNIILMHAVGANVSGQIASVIAGGLVIKLVSQYL